MQSRQHVGDVWLTASVDWSRSVARITGEVRPYVVSVLVDLAEVHEVFLDVPSTTKAVFVARIACGNGIIFCVSVRANMACTT